MESILGLGEYDSPTAVDDETSPSAGEPEHMQPSALELSIVDYENDPDEKPDGDATDSSVLGVTLDDEAVTRSVPRRVGVGGVQISVTKKVVARATTSAVATAELAEAPPAETVEDPEDRAVFMMPDSPTGEVDPKLAEKFMQLVAKTGEGYSVNEHIRNAKSFRNPDILEKLVSFFDVRECGTNYPKALYDPNDLSKDEHYDRLEDLRKKWEERQARKPGEKLVFASAGSVEAASSKGGAACSAGASGGVAQAATKPRKSKWDTSGGGGGAEPAAKRVAD